jgi:fused signal recognition particle receptor
VSEGLWIAIAVIAVLLVAALVVGLVRYRRRRISLSSPDTATPVDRSGGYAASSGITFSKSPPAEPVERIDTSGLPAVGDDATIPRDAPKRPIADVRLPEPPVKETGPTPYTIPEAAPQPVPEAAPEPVR